MLITNKEFEKLNNKVLLIPGVFKNYFLNLKDTYYNINIKLITHEEIINTIYYSYNDLLILEIMLKYKYSLKYSIKLVDIISKINDTNKLKLIPRRDWFDYYDEIFSYFVKNKDIYFQNLSAEDIVLFNPFNDNEIEKCLTFYKKEVTNHFEIKYEENDLSYYYFEDIESELQYVFNDIYKKLNSGVDINNILIYCNNSLYYYYLERYSKIYNLQLEGINPKRLSDFSLTKLFLSLLKEKEINEVFNLLDSSIKSDEDRTILNQIKVALSILDNLEHFNIKEHLWIINEILDNTEYKRPKYINVINVINKYQIIDENKYLYILSFDNKHFPKKPENNGILNDEELSLLDIINDHEKYLINYNKLQYFLKFNKNITITFSRTHSGTIFFPSLLIKRGIENNLINEFFIPKEVELIYSQNHSKSNIDNTIDAFYHSIFQNQIFEKYSHKFSHFVINKEDVRKYSYTKIEPFFECNFKYYMKYILKISDYEETLDIILGRIFHEILSNINLTNVNNIEEVANTIFEKYHSEILNTGGNRALTLSKSAFELFLLFLNKYKEIIKGTNIASISNERELVYKFDEIELSGQYDLLITTKSKKIIIIDFKTGTIKFNVDDINTGLNLQLPIYLFLLLNNGYKKEDILGTFLWGVLPKKAYQKDEFFEKEFNSETKLDGIFTLDEGEMFNTIDKEFIKVGKQNKKQFDEQLILTNFVKSLNEITEELIKEADGKIVNNDLKINPKSSDVCTYCPYYLACYKKYADYQEKEIEEEEEKDDQAN